MAKPILSNITVFDGTKGTTINFLLYSKAESVTYYVFDNETGKQVATGSAEITGLMSNKSFEFPAGKLTNQMYPYFIKIKTTYQSSDTELSDPVLFYCRKKPEFEFAGLEVSTPNTITSSSYQFELNYTYDTSQGESLNSYQYHLYDSTKELIVESKEYYGDIANGFTVDGFSNNGIYYIRGTGRSINGYEFDTGYIALQISYTVELNRALLNVENDAANGVIKVNSTIAFMDGVSVGEIEYVNIGGNNYAADLTDGSIAYTIPYETEGYSTSEYTLRVTVKPNIYNNLVIVSNEGDLYSVITNIRSFTDYGSDTSEKYYAILTGNEYVLESNYIDKPKTTDFITVDISFKDGLFAIYIKNVGPTGNMGGGGT